MSEAGGQGRPGRPGTATGDSPSVVAGDRPSVAVADPPDDGTPDEGTPERGRRPLIERIGLFLVALVLAALFGGIAAALLAGGELFLGIMAAIGCAMTVWVGGLTLLRG